MAVDVQYYRLSMLRYLIADPRYSQGLQAVVEPVVVEQVHLEDVATINTYPMLYRLFH